MMTRTAYVDHQRVFSKAVYDSAGHKWPMSKSTRVQKSGL